MDVGKIVDGDNADEHGWQLDQTSLFALLRSKQRFARTKISGAMRDLLDPLACTYGKVTHLNSRTALPILLRPAAIKRCGHTRAGPDKDNHVLRDRWDVAEARKARQKENKEQETADILGSKRLLLSLEGRGTETGILTVIARSIYESIAPSGLYPVLELTSKPRLG